MDIKKLTLVNKLFYLALIAGVFFSFSSSAPVGLSGAPGDGTCNNCHFGGTQTGTVDILGIVDVDNPIIPGKTYNVQVCINLISGTSPRAGFQFVALDGNTTNSASIGTLSNFGPNVGTMSSGSRTYAGHSGGEQTYTAGKATYTFDWTAPTSSPNDISFYVTANIANGSGTSGDLIVFDSDQSIALPVDLVEFKANDSGDGTVELTWLTASEVNSDYYEVLRSEDGRDFVRIAEVKAAGFSDQNQYYSYRDHEPILNRNSYYRLKQFDYNGQHFYSEVKTLQVENYENSFLNIFPNPASRSGCLFIDYFTEEAMPNAKFQVLDMYGRTVLHNEQLSSEIKQGFNKLVFDIHELSVGQYS